MNGSIGMGVVKVRKDDLLSTVIRNRDKHRAIFEAAVEGFRGKAIELLEQRLTDAKAGRRINVFINLPTPVDQTREYNRIIKMLEMSVDTEIELTQSEFTMYVMDDWSWKKQFSATNSMYTMSAASDSPVGDEDDQ
jgi:adenylate kinase family enzyme